MGFRKATMGDARLLYDWAMEPEVRANSLNPGSFSFADHVKWMEKKISDENCYLLIYTDENKNIGTCRLDIDENGIATIAYSVDKLFRGQGFGKKMVIDLEKFAMGKKNLQLKAVVKRENLASRKIFDSLGYLEKFKDEVLIYIKNIRGGV